VGHDNKIVRQRMRNQPVVCDLKKRRNRRSLIGLACGPSAYTGKGGHHRIVRRKKEGATARSCPIGEIVTAGLQFLVGIAGSFVMLATGGALGRFVAEVLFGR